MAINIANLNGLALANQSVLLDGSLAHANGFTHDLFGIPDAALFGAEPLPFPEALFGDPFSAQLFSGQMLGLYSELGLGWESLLGLY